MCKIAVITTAFGFGLENRETELAPVFRKHNLEAVYCTVDKLIQEQGMGCQGIIAGTEAVDKKLLNSCLNLKGVMKYGVGLDNFDLEEAKRLGIVIGNMPGINSDAVAEITLALMLAVSRKIVEHSYLYRQGEKRQICSHSLYGKTLGLIGVGTIGRMVAKLCGAFNMTCIGYDIVQNAEAAQEGIQYASWEELFSKSDVISIHIPLTKENYHLIGEKEIALMKKDAILLNTSRGGIVDEKALVKAIRNKALGGAGLDVFESKEVDPELAAQPEVVCTPHVAAYTHETLRRMDREVIRKIAGITA